jgi:hypothetical protein
MPAKVSSNMPREIRVNIVVTSSAGNVVDSMLAFRVGRGAGRPGSDAFIV